MGKRKAREAAGQPGELGMPTAELATAVEERYELDADPWAEDAGGGASAADEEDADAAQEPAAAPGAAAPKPGKPAPVLPWMRVPITIAAADGVLLEDVGGLDPRLRTALEGTDIEVLFPVQSVVWQETAGGAAAVHDVCIAAPTGSGKTLAYLLPVLQALSRRAVPCLRALVVLPTRDLAAQVFGVAAALCPALGLSAGAACGRGSLAAEAALLTRPAGAGIDLLVATPGRLIAHLEGTPGFGLSSLRFLVVDETDRLLRQTYQDWLPKLLAALGESPHHAGLAEQAKQQEQQEQEGKNTDWEERTAGGACRRVVKFVVSATLTRDPSKIQRLALHCPRYIATSAVDHRYSLPRTLSESKLVVPAELKPAALAALLAAAGPGLPTIVFTSSVEASHRLWLLLDALPAAAARTAGAAGLSWGRAVEFSSRLGRAERGASLEAFRRGEASVLVASDAMTRGMDVEGVGLVINYDAPVYAKTYVHRAGRTARAGRAGAVVTLLRREDVRHFKAMLRKADNSYVKDHGLDRGQIDAARPPVDAALAAVQAALRAEGAAGGADAPAAAAALVAAEPAAGKAAKGGVPAGEQRQQQRGQQPAAKRRKLAGVQEFLWQP